MIFLSSANKFQFLRFIPFVFCAFSFLSYSNYLKNNFWFVCVAFPLIFYTCFLFCKFCYLKFYRLCNVLSSFLPPRVAESITTVLKSIHIVFKSSYSVFSFPLSIVFLRYVRAPAPQTKQNYVTIENGNGFKLPPC